MRRSVLKELSKPFVFSKESQKLLDWHIAKYPEGRQASAVMPALDIAQRQNGGWISKEAIEAIASYLDMHAMKVWEVATFYTMYNLEPVGKHLIQVCRTTSCWLRGSDDVFEACKTHAKVEPGKPSEDGLFSLMEVECLGACVNAPMVQINDDYYEDLDAEKMASIIKDLRAGKDPKVGPQINRQKSAPASGATTNLKLVSPAGKAAKVSAIKSKTESTSPSQKKVDSSDAENEQLKMTPKARPKANPTGKPKSKVKKD